MLLVEGKLLCFSVDNNSSYHCINTW